MRTVRSVPSRRIRLLALPAVALLVAGCGGDAGPGSDDSTGSAAAGERVDVPGAGEAIIWGEGDYGVVLAHGAAFDAASWSAEAEEIAAAGNVVIAVEDTAPESIAAAAEYLMDEAGAGEVALIGGSAGADAILAGASADPGSADQLILLSANSAVEGLGPEPKLFIASEGEGVADVSTELAESSPGADNEALILSGSAHAQAIFEGDEGEIALDAILERLEEFAGA